jgi:hypothetical protein
MRSATYVKLVVLFLSLIVSFNADARKKKKKNAKPAVTQTAPVKTSKTDTAISSATVKASPVAVPVTTATVVKKQEEIKPFAQLVISFTSMGAGINSKARDQFLEHITWFNEQNHCELMFDKKPWGREGEIDYCFYGNNQILIPMLYKQLKEKFNGVRQIFINQNFPCK